MDDSEGEKVEREGGTVDELAAMLGIGRNQAYEAVKRGEIPSIRIGKRIIVPLKRVRRMLDGEAA